MSYFDNIPEIARIWLHFQFTALFRDLSNSIPYQKINNQTTHSQPLSTISNSRIRIIMFPNPTLLDHLNPLPHNLLRKISTHQPRQKEKYVCPCFSSPRKTNQLVNPHTGPLQRSSVFAIGLYSFSALETVGIMYCVPNSFGSCNKRRISESASGGRLDRSNGNSIWIVRTE